MAFCDNLVYLRKKHGLTQEDLAEEFDVSRQAVSKWETGESLPETEKLIDMCEKFSVSLDELLRGDLTKREISEEDGTKASEAAEEVFTDMISAPADEAETSDESAAARTAHAEKARLIIRLNSALVSTVFLLTVAAYLMMGCVWNLWHPGWIVFLFGLCLITFCEAILRFARTRRFEISGTIFLLAVAIYVLVGCVWNLWHPGWIVFLFGLCLITLCEDITRFVRTRRFEISGTIFLLAVAIYVLIGCVWCLWHPGWIVFIAAIAVIIVLEAVSGKS